MEGNSNKELINKFEAVQLNTTANPQMEEPSTSKKLDHSGIVAETQCKKVTNFKTQLHSELQKIREMCSTWERISTQAVLPCDKQELALAAVGQVRLLMTQKQQQFSVLLRCVEQSQPEKENGTQDPNHNKPCTQEDFEDQVAKNTSNEERGNKRKLFTRQNAIDQNVPVRTQDLTQNSNQDLGGANSTKAEYEDVVVNKTVNPVTKDKRNIKNLWRQIAFDKNVSVRTQYNPTHDSDHDLGASTSTQAESEDVVVNKTVNPITKDKRNIRDLWRQIAFDKNVLVRTQENLAHNSNRDLGATSSTQAEFEDVVVNKTVDPITNEKAKDEKKRNVRKLWRQIVFDKKLSVRTQDNVAHNSNNDLGGATATQAEFEDVNVNKTIYPATQATRNTTKEEKVNKKKLRRQNAFDEN